MASFTRRPAPKRCVLSKALGRKSGKGPEPFCQTNQKEEATDWVTSSLKTFCTIFILIQMTPKSAAAPRITGKVTSRGLSLRGAVLTTGAGLGAGAGVTCPCVMSGRLSAGHHAVVPHSSLHSFSCGRSENNHSIL